jgi:ABC-type arginine transport system permease subunit
VLIADAYIDAQVMTLAIPLGTFCVALILGFFVRYRHG